MAQSTPLFAYVLASILGIVLLGFGGLLLFGNLIQASRTATLGWRVVDVQGRFVGEQVFDEARPFSEGLAAVQLEGRWGFVDAQGRIAIPPRFDDVGPFTEGRAGAREGAYWGVIDDSGAWIREPDLDRVGPFVDGIAVCTRQVGVATSRITSSQPLRSSGLLDRDGAWIVEPRAKDDPDRWQSARGPEHGRVLVEQERGWRLFDLQGQPVGDHRFAKVNAPGEGVFAFQQDEAWGLARMSGETLIPPSLQWVGPPGEGLVPVGRDSNRADYVQIDDGAYLGLQGVLDARPHHDGLGAVLTQGGWGYIDARGTVVIPATWRDARAASKRSAPVQGPDGWVLVDREGRVQAGPFKDLTPLDGGVGLARVPRG